MSDKRIVYTKPGGGVAVVVPAPAYVAQFSTEDEALQDLIVKDVPEGVTDATIIDKAKLPDRLNRNGWTFDPRDKDSPVKGVA